LTDFSELGAHYKPASPIKIKRSQQFLAFAIKRCQSLERLVYNPRVPKHLCEISGAAFLLKK
jgi:hypothetical protein